MNTLLSNNVVQVIILDISGALNAKVTARAY